jgi:predicted lysophospholipase L1 biosynthesis ABC-type transport system permease subunit
VDVSLAGPDALPPERFYAGLSEILSALPGVRGVALASNLPLTDRQNQSDVFDAARSREVDEVGTEAWTARVSDEYFEVMGQPLVAGRAFDGRDREGPATAVVSRALAAALWPGESGVGERIRVGDAELEVVGVAGDAPYEMINESPRAALFLPYWRRPTSRVEVVVLGAGADPALPSRIAQAGRQVDPAVPVFAEKTLSAHLAGSLWMFRLAAGLAAALGFLATGLALAGLYGVMAHGVQQRRGEIGIRLALGATRGRIAAAFLGRGLRVAGAGVALGLVAGAGAAQLVRGLVVGVSPHDPLAFGAVAVAVTGFALLACLAPALAASRADPATSLRTE